MMALLTRALTRAHSSRPFIRSSSHTLYTTSRAGAPYKKTQDKDSLSPQSAENVKSARDDDIAGLEKTAYKPGEPGPEAARRQAQDETKQKGDPLEFSGANQELSKPRGDEKSQLDRASGKDANGTAQSSGGEHSQKDKL